MKKVISLLLATILLLACLFGCKSDEEFVPPLLSSIDLSNTPSIEGLKDADSRSNYVLIDVADYGKILVRLFPEVAPKTVEHFKSLVSRKYYDGLLFHRVVNGFVIQGGSSDGFGYEGSGENIFGEFSANGFENNLCHFRGVVSMARANDFNSASGQFFIVQSSANRPSLDGKYASFGYIVYGMDTVDDIASVPTNSTEKPLQDIVIKSISFVDASALSYDK